MAAFTITIQVETKGEPNIVGQQIIDQIKAAGHEVLAATTTNSVDTTPAPKPE